MDGRFVVRKSHEDRWRIGNHDRSMPTTKDGDDDGTIDESDLVRAPDQDEADGDEEDNDAVDSEMVLSKDDFDLLQAFHRLVPLPALRAKILRVVCDDDLQVTEEEREFETSLGTNAIPTVAILSACTTVAKHSPLTRRLSTKPSTAKSSVGSLLIKPHREVNLESQTLRIRKPTTVSLDERSGDDRLG